MINDLSDLKKLLRLCRSQGVTEIKLGTIELKFGDMPKDVPRETTQEDIDHQIDEMVGLVDGVDPMAFYSVDSQ